MIECPFCSEIFEEDKLVFEFNWGEVAAFYYNRGKLPIEPKAEFQDRSFYVSFNYDWRGYPQMASMEAAVNPEKHPNADPICSQSNGWPVIQNLLRRKNVFRIRCAKDNRTMPLSAVILPIAKTDRRSSSHSSKGSCTGMFCPYCEQQLKPEVLQADSEIRILLSGHPGSGKTIYLTQAISVLMGGQLSDFIKVEPVNQAVHEHYISNKNLLKPMGKRFIMANNPAVAQDPYVFLLHNGSAAIRLVIQDIAGEDVKNRTKYSQAVRKADMIMYFVDPWHIEEIRSFHQKQNDMTVDIVKYSTKGLYTDLNGVFQMMMNEIDREFTEERDQLAAVMLIKGDYLDPPMLSHGDRPEHEMMRQPISFNDPEEMEFTIGMRSGFIRQNLFSWESTRIFARDLEGKYAPGNTRYFVSTALGQSTHLRHGEDPEDGESSPDDPSAQFSVPGAAEPGSGPWNYEEQVLESPARPENVIDPIFWCMKRKGIRF